MSNASLAVQGAVPPERKKSSPWVFWGRALVVPYLYSELRAKPQATAVSA